MVAENTSVVTKLSFFDSDQVMPTFWRQRDLADFATYPLIAECKFFLKTNKTFFKWDSCHLSIRGNFLIYSKGKKKTQNIIEYIDLDANMYKLTTSAPNQSKRYNYNFTVSSHGNFATFYSKDKKQFNAFLLQMRRYCVMTEFTDHYQVLDVLGHGGYGQVYLVQDKITKLKYAGKVIQISPRRCLDKQKVSSINSFQCDPFLKLMIMNEIKILKKLDHQNIIKLYEVYEKNNEVCLILEYVQGQRLFEYIVHSGRLSEPETALLMKQLFLTLTYLESQGILHRDIKPENILITKSENKVELKLIDFGLATDHSKTDTIKKCGTAGYTAPEVLAGDPYDFKADLYSSGIVMFICLTGRPAYYGNEYKELYEENKKGIVKYKDRHWSDISKEAKELVQKILVSNPSQRASIDRVLAHKWFESILTPDEVKQITEFNFKTGKMLVAEEEKIANVPVLPSQMLKNFSLNSKSNSMGSASFSFITSKVGIASNNSHLMLHSFYKNRTKEEVDASSVNTLNSQPVRHSSFFKNTSTLNHKRSIFLNMKEKSDSKDFQKHSSATMPKDKGENLLLGTNFKLSSFVKENIKDANNESNDDNEDDDDDDLTFEEDDDDDEESTAGRKYERLKGINFCFEKLAKFANHNN